MTKVAITSIYKKVNLKGDSAFSFNCLSLRDYYGKVKGYDVEYVGTKGPRTKVPDYYVDVAEENFDFNDYDKVVVVCTPENFFGGIVDKNVYHVTGKLLEYKGELLTYLDDTTIPFTNPYTYILGRMHSIRNLEDFPGLSDRDQLEKWSTTFANLPWHALWAGTNYHKWLDDYQNKVHHMKIVNHDNLLIPVMNGLNMKFEPFEVQEKDTDLVYFGALKPERKKCLEKYFKNDVLNTRTIGFPADWPNNEAITKNIPFRKLFSTINKSWASIMPSEPILNDNLITSRFFEIVKAKMICFIDADYDPNHRLIQNENLRKVLYVSTPEEIKEKLDKIRSKPGMFDKILEMQFDEFKHWDEYKIHEEEEVVS